jgi:putative transposase
LATFGGLRFALNPPYAALFVSALRPLEGELVVIPDYRRYRVPGGCYFFTVNLLERRGNDLLTRHIDRLRDAVRTVRRARPFAIEACVVLPDHLHCVWTLPPGDSDFSTRWRLVKTIFARSLPVHERRSEVRRRRHERGIWHRRFWEHAIRDDRDFGTHVDYVHFNPVKHGYVAAPADWPHSTFRACVRRGLYPEGWLGPGDHALSAEVRGEPMPKSSA